MRRAICAALAALTVVAPASALAAESTPCSNVTRPDAMLSWALHWKQQAGRNARALNRIRVARHLRPVCVPELTCRTPLDMGRAYKRLAYHYARQLRRAR